MTKFMILADLEAEHINGGHFFSFSSTSWKTAITNVGQSNTATNIGLGLGGFGNAISAQSNFALVGTILS